MMDASNTLIEELKIFLKSILSWLITFGVLSVIFFSYPVHKSVSVIVFERVRHDLLPDNVQLVTTNPMGAFTAQIMLSLLLGFLATTPYFLYKLTQYLK